MPKTERILSYLPSTFRVFPRAPVLYAVVDAFGNELLSAENTLAEVMSAHWVDHADRNAKVVDDLQRLAALYGLAPRRSEDGQILESVEEFREHLKRYVRTFLEGTVTVQGILRVTAEALGLSIADDYADLDSWWTRKLSKLITRVPRRDDIATVLFGSAVITAIGNRDRAAQIKGTVNLSGHIDLSQTPTLRLKIDSASPVTINLIESVADPTSVSVTEHIIPRINQTVNATIENGFLILTSPTTGRNSRLEIQDIVGDAAEKLLGLAPRKGYGSSARAAQVIGTADLSSGVNLSQERYLRLVIDNTQIAEIDCTNGDVSSPKTLDQIQDAINSAGSNIASHDGHFLRLTSPTQGAGSSITFQEAAAQDARVRLFGQGATAFSGQPAQPAILIGKRNLSQGIDLRDHANIRIKIDNTASVTINCAGDNPANTQISEIVNSINTALRANIAKDDGRFVTLKTITTGENAEISLETPEIGDATEAIFGIGVRKFQGVIASSARIVGAPNLSSGINLMAQHVFQVAIDGRQPTMIDLRAQVENPNLVSLSQLRYAINQVVGENLASDDGEHLILSSSTLGSASRLEIAPLQQTKQRHFVTRAIVTDEAAQVVFGFTAADAIGTPATSAQVTGEIDLSRGVDLRQQRFLRLAVDNQAPVEVDFLNSSRIARPRAAMIDEIVNAIRDRIGSGIISHNGKNLIFRSPSVGAGSRIAFELPRATDALETLLGIPPGLYRGQESTSVSFVGTVNLRDGITLPATAAIRLSIDGAAPVEVSLAGPEPNQKTIDQLVSAINLAFTQNIASHDGVHLILSSQTAGANSHLEFLVPTATDVTSTIFGITAPRVYQGEAASSARVVGIKDLSNGADLRLARFLRLAIQGNPPIDVDCASSVAEADLERVPLDRIIANINTAIAPATATQDSGHLIIASNATGITAQIEVQQFFDVSSDARETILGNVAATTLGKTSEPAKIVGKVNILSSVNLAKRQILRLSINEQDPVEINIAGNLPEKTSLDEAISKINTVFPNLASATNEGFLQLTASPHPQTSRLSILPLRYIELIEYPPIKTLQPFHQTVQHGASWAIQNDGVADTIAEITITAPQGVAGLTLVNESLGWQVRLLAILAVGETARLWQDETGRLQAITTSITGETRSIPASEILVGLVEGVQTRVPFVGNQLLPCDSEATLQLNAPLSANLVTLRAIQQSTTISVTEHVLSATGATTFSDGETVRLVGRVQFEQTMYRLVGLDQRVIATLRAGTVGNFESYLNQVVAVQGVFYQDGSPLVIVEAIANLFDVILRQPSATGGEVVEEYIGVTIGGGTTESDSLVQQINAGSPASQLVRAEELPKGSVLTLPQGESRWRYLDCDGSRFNQAEFDRSYFAGGRCIERGVFNVSHFSSSVEPLSAIAAIFTSATDLPNPSVDITFNWVSHRPGAFTVNLPSDLPPRFGGKFNEAHFSQAANEPEVFANVVTEPVNDPNNIVQLLNQGRSNVNPPIAPSNLVQAQQVSQVPPGWQPIQMPFRKLQFLTKGTLDSPARLYLAEEGFNGFIELSAREVGIWGNEIAISTRPAGPAMYDLSILYTSSRFENARSVVQGGETLPVLTEDLLKPGAIGVLQAKASGVYAIVTRDDCGD